MTSEEAVPKKRPRYRKAVGTRLKPVLQVAFVLFGLLSINAGYLLGVRLLEEVSGNTYQNWFFMIMFLGHLVLGLLIVLPVIGFGIAHIRNTHNRPNRRAVRVGYALFATAIVLLLSGVVLVRLDGVIVIKDPAARSIAWWLHVITPVAAGWLFVLHRLAGPKMRWDTARKWAVAAVVSAGALLVLQAQDPRDWGRQGPESGETYFFPSLARTSTGDFIPAEVLDNNEYCQECHQDTHERWSNSVHKFSSFNNPPYAASVKETRLVSAARDGDVEASRFCAGCHDPVPFFSGRFDEPDFDGETDPTGQAGITCTACHAITHLNSPRGNSDYTIEEPQHYPFAFSDNATLGWINRQLIKAKPEFHKKTFLKPLHTETEFCASCHKVHLPEQLNDYKWLRGQNHYDSFLLSGVSGHGASSFYYPPVAQANCNGCHMEPLASDDFGARRIEADGPLAVHDHLFPSANTAIPTMLGLPDWVNEAHVAFNEGKVRVDLFALRAGGEVDGEFIGPLRPAVPELIPGESYLIEAVVRTVGLGHLLTQGTSDSNQLWVEMLATSGGRVIGRSGAMDEDRIVDPWSHFINSYVLDREGNRIDRRNAQDIFVALYNHQIPPGAADAVHYLLNVPRGLTAPVEVEVSVRYRKFDTTYMRHVFGADYVNDLPVMTLATDRVVFPVRGLGVEVANPPREIVEWQRYNDYGIGLLRKGGKTKGQLRQAETAFARVEELNRADGPLNLARVYFAQGTVEDRAIAALERASSFDPPAPAWTVAWFTGLVNQQNGFLDEAIVNFRSILAATDETMRSRGFDFSKDYRVHDQLGQALFERAKEERGDRRAPERERFLNEAAAAFEATLALDPENVSAHFNLDLVYRQLGQATRAEQHRSEYLRYKPDDNARGRAITAARRRDPAADHAAEAIVIYDLSRALSAEAGRFASPLGPAVLAEEPNPTPNAPSE